MMTIFTKSFYALIVFPSNLENMVNCDNLRFMVNPPDRNVCLFRSINLIQ